MAIMNNTTEVLDLYPHRKGSFQKELMKLKKDKNITQRNRELITSFHNHLFTKGCGEVRVTKLSQQVRFLCQWLLKGLHIEKDLDALEQEHVEALATFIKQSKVHAEATKADYRRALKQFYNWYKRKDPRLDSDDRTIRKVAQNFYWCIEKDLRASFAQKKADPATVLNWEDCHTVIKKGCNSVREQAFLALLLDTGLRAQEFLNLRIGDVKLHGDYGKVYVRVSKTLEREVPIHHAIPYMTQYLEVHRFKENDGAFLWICEATNHRGNPLGYKGGQNLINAAVEAAGVQKKHNFHWFRHSCATNKAPFFTEAVMCKMMGWKIGSKEIQTYAHLCQKQVDDAFKKAYGLQSDGEKQDSLSIQCVCGRKNPPRTSICSNCKRVLGHYQELMNEEVNKTVQWFMNSVATNPELLSRFKEFEKLIK